MSYQNTIQASISLNTATTTKAGFGTPLFIASHHNYPDRIRSYSKTSEMTDDGFLETDPAYVAARQAFSQSPSVPFVKIGRRNEKWTASVSEAADVASEVYSFKVNLPNENYETVISYTATNGNETQETIVAGLEAAFTNDTTLTASLDVSAVEAGSASSIEISAKDAEVFFTVTDETGDFTSNYSSAETPVTTLAAIDLEDNDYFFVVADDRSDAYVELMSAEIQARDKLYFYSTYDFAELAVYAPESTANVANQLKDKGRTKTVGLFHQASDEFIELGYVGVNAPYDAGSVTWANVRVVGAGTSTNPNTGKVLSSTYKNNLTGKNVNYVELDNNNPYVRSGVTAGGEWIDTMRGVAWMENDLTVSLKNLLINQAGGKVAFTEVGETMVREVLMSSLQRAVNRGFINDDYEVNIPVVNELDPSERATRILENITFKATLQGAVHQIFVSGTVSS